MRWKISENVGVAIGKPDTAFPDGGIVESRASKFGRRVNLELQVVEVRRHGSPRRSYRKLRCRSHARLIDVLSVGPTDALNGTSEA